MRTRNSAVALSVVGMARCLLDVEPSRLCRAGVHRCQSNGHLVSGHLHSKHVRCSFGHIMSSVAHLPCCLWSWVLSVEGPRVVSKTITVRFFASGPSKEPLLESHFTTRSGRSGLQACKIGPGSNSEPLNRLTRESVCVVMLYRWRELVKRFNHTTFQS